VGGDVIHSDINTSGVFFDVEKFDVERFGVEKGGVEKRFAGSQNVIAGYHLGRRYKRLPGSGAAGRDCR